MGCATADTPTARMNPTNRRSITIAAFVARNSTRPSKLSSGTRATDLLPVHPRVPRLCARPLNPDACGTGEVCCPLTKICVIPGADCKTPCADAGTFCCPDAKHCLTPVKAKAGLFCDPNVKTSCATGEVCCPLIKECVTVGAACTAP